MNGEGYGIWRYGVPIATLSGFVGSLALVLHSSRLNRLFGAVAVLLGLMVALLTLGRGVLLDYLVIVNAPIFLSFHILMRPI